MEFYIIFALTTALTALITVFLPAKRDAPLDHVFQRAPRVSGAIFIVIMTLVAPLVVPILFSEKIRNAFVEGMLSS